MSLHIGEFLTRSTVWLALSCYVGAEAIRSGAPHLHRQQVARLINTAGCLLFMAHVACAFHFYHHWSHAAAYADTAGQTARYFGFNSGFGLYFNYLFLVLWIVQVITSWISVAATQPLAPWLTRTVRAFVLLMIFNGTVIFAHGPIKWFGLVLSALLLVSWFRSRG